VDVLVNPETKATREEREEALEWLCAQHFLEVEIIVSFASNVVTYFFFPQSRGRPLYNSVIAAVNSLLPLPIAEEIVPHYASL
jgi:hypothetical protein